MSVEYLRFSRMVVLAVSRNFEDGRVAVFVNMRNISCNILQVDRFRKGLDSVQIVGLRYYAYVQGYWTQFNVNLLSLRMTNRQNIVSGRLIVDSVFAGGSVGKLRWVGSFKTFGLLCDVSAVERGVDFDVTRFVYSRMYAFDYLYILVEAYEFWVSLRFDTYFFDFGLDVAIVFILRRV